MITTLVAMLFSSSCTDSIRPFSLSARSQQVMGFKLEISKLEDVMRVLGKTKIYKSGDAGESDMRINYYIDAIKAYITFGSGEMGGRENYITHITIQNEIHEEFKPIKRKLDSLDFLGMKLGQNMVEIQPLHRMKIDCDSIAFGDNRPLKIRNEDFNEMRTFLVYFKNKKLNKATIYQVTSN